MGTTLAVTFPLGRYHATRWDGGANTSDVEWPPSPWRVLRAIVATWYARWPDLPAETMDRILATLGTPDAYSTPPVRPGSTRHYMPDLKHNRGETGNTDLVLDTFLAVPPGRPLMINWRADLSAEDRATLGKLVELMPYLGRSESLCLALLREDDPVPDETWWRLGESGPEVRQVELLAPDGAPERSALEATTVATRKANRLIPVGSRRVTYGMRVPEQEPGVAVIQRRESITCLRFDLSSSVPVRARNGVLIADALHAALSQRLTQTAVDPAAAAFVGRTAEGGPRQARHDHAHIFALPAVSAAFLRASEPLSSVYVWAPGGIPDLVVGTIQRRIRKLWTHRNLEGEMASQFLLSAGSGSADELLPGFASTATEWVSVTPYLPVRHQKRRQTPGEHVTSDLEFECMYRNIRAPVSVELVDAPEHRREIIQFRRRRASEPMSEQRRGIYLRLRFDRPVGGPLLLGQLSHFGFGLFRPA